MIDDEIKRLEREASRLRIEKRDREFAERRAQFPDGWEKRVIDAVITALKANKAHTQIELIEHTEESQRWLMLGVSFEIYAVDHKKIREEEEARRAAWGIKP